MKTLTLTVIEVVSRVHDGELDFAAVREVHRLIDQESTSLHAALQRECHGGDGTTSSARLPPAGAIPWP
jgi:hypothetical protein